MRWGDMRNAGLSQKIEIDFAEFQIMWRRALRPSAEMTLLTELQIVASAGRTLAVPGQIVSRAIGEIVVIDNGDVAAKSKQIEGVSDKT